MTGTSGVPGFRRNPTPLSRAYRDSSLYIVCACQSVSCCWALVGETHPRGSWRNPGTPVSGAKDVEP